MKKIGPRMHDVVSFVAANPGLPMIAAARHVGPNGSLRYGYETVHRAFRAGLIEWRNGERGSRLCFVAGTAL